MLWGRGHLIRFIEARGDGLGKPTTDRFACTLQVLVATLVAASAWPLVTAILGWQVQASSIATDVTGAVGEALLRLAMQFYYLRALHLSCMPRGLAAAHFRWPEPNLRLLQRELDRLSWTYLPGVGVLLVIVHLDPVKVGWAAGHTAFVILVAALAFSLFRLLHSTTGLLAHATRRPGHPPRPLLYPLWHPLLAMAPLALGLLDLLGYIDTVGVLLAHFVSSVWLVVGLFLLSALARRGLKVAPRRIAHQAALQRRQAARQARPLAQQSDGAVDKPDQTEVNEPEADLGSLSDASGKLIRTTAIRAVCTRRSTARSLPPESSSPSPSGTCTWMRPDRCGWSCGIQRLRRRAGPAASKDRRRKTASRTPPEQGLAVAKALSRPAEKNSDRA